ERTIDDTGLDGFGSGDDVSRDLLVIRPDDHFASGDAGPAVVRDPGTGHDILDHLDIVRCPDVDDSGQVRLGREGAHVGALAETTDDAAFFGNLESRRAVRVLHDDVGTLVDEGAGG